ncbi:hypothetical protein KI387_014320 [Taxus chinensis]|uniref:Uncharacterized protein n=1 Tax=Taxus chinensis TaxID=29808 RepID=A0AA38CRL5_TAXCH|nr:hypothetical protein KI387_014320 [Taxus chinensis]
MNRLTRETHLATERGKLRWAKGSQRGSFALDLLVKRNLMDVTKNVSFVPPRKTFIVLGPRKLEKIAMYSAELYAACTMGGILSFGLTHTSVIPPVLISSNM